MLAWNRFRRPSILNQYIRYFTTSTTINKAEILYLDKHYCIVNKPANICLDGKDETTMEKLTTSTLDAMNHEYKYKIRHCHQLDKLTSGILIYGLNQNSTKKMNKIIQNRDLTKIYYAIIHGHIPSNINHFILDFPITDDKEVMIVNNNKEGRPAITECIVEKIGFFRSKINQEQQIPVSLLKIKLFTGRRHQIRLHLSHIGHPIIGDKKYSNNHKLFDRMYLDSHRTTFNINIENTQKLIDVQTNSNQEFDVMIINKDGNGNKNNAEFEYDDLSLIDHDCIIIQ